MKQETAGLEITDEDIQPNNSDSHSLMRLIERAAFSPDVDAAKLNALLDVKSRWDAMEAKKAYDHAMTLFKAHPPAITKNKQVKFGNTEFRHTTLDHACDLIVPALSAVGITHRYKTSQTEKAITVTCVLTHEQGHSEETTLLGMPDTSGSKNAIQSVGSTVTYLERYTLMAATGLAAEGTDDDGRGGAPGEEGTVSMKGLEDWLEKFKECITIEELQKEFGKAWNIAADAKDFSSQKVLASAKDERKAQLRRK